MSFLKAVDIRSEPAVRLLGEFLNTPELPRGAEQFAHELYTWLRSPYKDLRKYDEVVQVSRVLLLRSTFHFLLCATLFHFLFCFIPSSLAEHCESGHAANGLITWIGTYGTASHGVSTTKSSVIAYDRSRANQSSMTTYHPTVARLHPPPAAHVLIHDPYLALAPSHHYPRTPHNPDLDHDPPLHPVNQVNAIPTFLAFQPVADGTNRTYG